MVYVKSLNGGAAAHSVLTELDNQKLLASINPIPHGADSALLQIVFFITSSRDAAEPENLVIFPKM